MNTSKVTRFEVIGNKGLVLHEYVKTLMLELQDDGQTLKVFIDENADDESVKKHFEAIFQMFEDR